MAIAALGFLAGVAPVSAGGGDDCCADLEARIADLEALTARKGNRALSLQISGTINQAELAWYDGRASNVYTVTNDNNRSRFGFAGKAMIDPNWEIGYRIEIGIKSANSLRVNQLSPVGFDNRGFFGTDIRESRWYVKRKDIGTLLIGSSFAATDRIADANLTQTN